MIEYIAITTLILISGSIWGWASPVVPIANLVSCLLLLYKKIWGKKIWKLSKSNLAVFLIIFFIHLINIAFVSRLNPLTCWYEFVVIIGAYLLCELVDREEFCRKYINIMVVLASMSLFFWFFAKFGVILADHIIVPGNGKLYRMNLFYIYRDFHVSVDATLNRRNFGIFWEGGAFQAFLNLALFFHIRKTNVCTIDRKKFWGITAILASTILTTFSTTGYFILILNFAIYMFENTKAFSVKRLLLMAVGIVAMAVILSSPTVINKFSSGTDAYQSYAIRLNDHLGGLKAMLVSPIWGLGYNSEQYTAVLNSYGIYANSSGLFIVVQQFGVIYGIWYTVCQLKNSFRYLSDDRPLKRLFLAVLLLMMFLSEPLNQNGIFVMFAFATRNKNETLKKTKFSRIGIYENTVGTSIKI